MVDVVISPSSQTANQYTGGGTGAADSESRHMRDVAPILHDLLLRNDIESRLLTSMDLYTRMQQSNAIKPLLHFPLHSNAGGGHGSGFYIYSRGGKSEIMAAAMAAAMAPVTPTADDGVRVYNHYDTRMAVGPAVIAEVEFHDNAEDAEWIRSHKREIAVALARGIIAGLAAAYGGRFVAIAARPLILDAGSGAAPVVVAPAPVVVTPAPVIVTPVAVAPKPQYPYVALVVDGGRGKFTVRAWQVLLHSIGRYSGDIDGDWGRMSIRAEQEWLVGLGLYPAAWVDGVEGKATVEALQAFLSRKGLYPAAWIDGARGEYTVKAEQNYLNGQRKYL